MDRLDFALIGPGRLGRRLAQQLVQAGFHCRALRGHGEPPSHLANMMPGCEVFDTPSDPAPWPPVALVLVTVPDREIAATARSVAGGAITPGTVVLHCSGLHTSRLLEPCRRAGAAIGSWHPLQSFPSGTQPVDLTGVWCAIEGDGAAVKAAEELSTVLGMRPWRIEPGDKVRYHAAASLAANLGHVLVVAAGELLAGSGIPASPPASALEPLMRTSLGAALEARGFEALTGPISRGDRETIARHLGVLPPELREAYLQIARFVTNHQSVVPRDSIDPRNGDV